MEPDRDLILIGRFFGDPAHPPMHRAIDEGPESARLEHIVALELGEIPDEKGTRTLALRRRPGCAQGARGKIRICDSCGEPLDPQDRALEVWILDPVFRREPTETKDDPQNADEPPAQPPPPPEPGVDGDQNICFQNPLSSPEGKRGPSKTPYELEQAEEPRYQSGDSPPSDGPELRYAAVDFGASTLAVSVDRYNGAAPVKLGKILRTIDSDPLEASDELISSLVGLSENLWWRGDFLPQTLARETSTPWSAQKVLEAKDRELLPSVPAFPGKIRDAYADSFVLPAPKMRILTGEPLQRAPGAQSIRRLDLSKDVDDDVILRAIFRELGEVYVRGDDLEACAGARLVLTRPCLFSPAHIKRLKQAAVGFAAAVGAQAEPESMMDAPEPLAAALDLAKNRFSSMGAPREGRLRLLAYDIGAGTLDVAAIEAEWMKRERFFRIWRQKALVGLPIGGDYLDRVLAAMADAWLERLLKKLGAPYKSLLRNGEEGWRGAPDLMAAIRKAKRRLFEGLIHGRADSPAQNAALSDWTNRSGLWLKIPVGSTSGSGALWMIKEGSRVAERLRAFGAEGLRIEGARLRLDHDESAGGEAILLEMNDEAMKASDAMRTTLDLMVGETLKPVLHALKKDKDWGEDFVFDALFVSGRASLWPPLRAALDRFFASGLWKKHFQANDPEGKTLLSWQLTDPARLKTAVVRGAMDWGTQGYGGNGHENIALRPSLMLDEDETPIPLDSRRLERPFRRAKLMFQYDGASDESVRDPRETWKAQMMALEAPQTFAASAPGDAIRAWRDEAAGKTIVEIFSPSEGRLRSRSPVSDDCASFPQSYAKADGPRPFSIWPYGNEPFPMEPWWGKGEQALKILTGAAE